MPQHKKDKVQMLIRIDTELKKRLDKIKNLDKSAFINELVSREIDHLESRSQKDLLFSKNGIFAGLDTEQTNELAGLLLDAMQESNPEIATLRKEIKEIRKDLEDKYPRGK